MKSTNAVTKCNLNDETKLENPFELNFPSCLKGIVSFYTLIILALHIGSYGYYTISFIFEGWRKLLYYQSERCWFIKCIQNIFLETVSHQQLVF